MSDVLSFEETVEYPQARFEQWISRVISFSTEYSRAWGANCVIGKPKNYPRHGDLQGSWASRSYREEREFIEVEFDHPCVMTELLIYETYNPGAIIQIQCKEYDDGSNPDINDNWIELWSGDQNSNLPGVSRIFRPVLQRHVLTNRIRIDLQLRGMRSWSEIDAVKMIGLRPIQEVLKPSRFSLDLRRFYNNREYHDVLFNFPHSNYQVKGHLGMICSRSDMFKKMFSCGMKESIDAKESEIQIITMLEDVQPSVFEMLLEFIYCNHILVLLRDIVPLYILGDFYAMTDLKTYLEKYLGLIITHQNVFALYNQMIELESDVVLKKMKMMCLNYILKNEKHIMSRREVKKCKIFEILKKDLKDLKKKERRDDEEEEDDDDEEKKTTLKSIASTLFSLYRN